MALPLLLPGLIGGAISLGGQLFAGRRQRQIRNEQNRLIDQQEQRAQQQRAEQQRIIDEQLGHASRDFNRLYNVNFTDTAEGRQALQGLRDIYANANRQSMLTGGNMTNEARLARQAQQTAGMAQAKTGMSAMDSQRRAGLRANYQDQRNMILGQTMSADDRFNANMGNVDAQRFGLFQNQVQQWDNFANNAGNIGSGIGGLLTNVWGGAGGAVPQLAGAIPQGGNLIGGQTPGMGGNNDWINRHMA